MIRRKKGFTLLEMLVVVGIVALALPAVFAIIFSIVRQQSKVYALSQVKKEGDFILNKMETTIRNEAEAIYEDSEFTFEACDQAGFGTNPYSSDGILFYFKKDDETLFRFLVVEGSMVFENVGSTSDYISTPKVAVSNLSLTCNRTGSFSPPVIAISFDVTYGESSFIEDTATLHYQTQVQMKSF